MSRFRSSYSGRRRKALPSDSESLVFHSTLLLLGLIALVVLWAAASASAAAPLAVEPVYLGEWCIDPATDGDLTHCFGLDPMELLADEAQFLRGEL